MTACLDDDLDFAEGIADLLEARGYVSIVANSGEEALEKIKVHDVDVTLMDVMMPGMNGVDTFKAVREIEPEASVVLMTGYTIERLLQDAVNSGAKGVLHKPVGIDDLFSMLGEIGREEMVLLVDDDQDFAQAACHYLQDEGYKVEVVNSGSAAIERIVNNGITVLILDLKMPNIDGVDVIKRLEELGVTIPTILVTAYRDEQSSRLAELGKLKALSGILEKPFDPRRLVDMIANIDTKTGT
jgi:two-component system response regulator HydG